MELNRLLEIAADRETCDFCPENGDKICVNCKQVRGIKLDELREYHVAVKSAIRRTAEYNKTREEGRFVVLPCKVGAFVFVSPNNGKSFHKAKLFGKNEKGSYLVQLCDDLLEEDEKHLVSAPMSKIFYDWFFTVYTRQEAEEALGGGRDV